MKTSFYNSLGFIVAVQLSTITSNANKDQSNLAKGGIAVASSPNSSFVFARWQHRTDGLAAICYYVLCLGVRPLNLPFL